MSSGWGRLQSGSRSSLCPFDLDSFRFQTLRVFVFVLVGSQRLWFFVRFFGLWVIALGFLSFVMSFSLLLSHTLYEYGHTLL